MNQMIDKVLMLVPGADPKRVENDLNVSGDLEVTINRALDGMLSPRQESFYTASPKETNQATIIMDSDDELPSTSFTSVQERKRPTLTNEINKSQLPMSVSTTNLDNDILNPEKYKYIIPRTTGTKNIENRKTDAFLEISDSDSENEAYQICRNIKSTASTSTSNAIPTTTNFPRNKEQSRISSSPESLDSEFLPPAFSDDEHNSNYVSKTTNPGTSGISMLGKHTISSSGLSDGERCAVPIEEPLKKKIRRKGEIEEQKKEALLKREVKKRQKDDIRAAEQQQKKFKIQKEKLQKQANKLNKPTVLGGCTKFVTACLDPNLLPADTSEHVESPILQKLFSLGADYRVEPQTYPGSITWIRTSVQHSVLEDELKITSSTTSSEENQVLIVLAAEKFAEMVFSFKEAYQTQQAAVLGEDKTLVDFTKDVKCCYHGKKVTFLLHGLEKYMRNLKTKQQRAFRSVALVGTVEEGNAGNCRRRKNTTASVDVTRTDIEEALVDLQFKTNVCVYPCETDEDIAVKVVAFTKAIAEKPYKKSLTDGLAFCMDKLDKTSLKVSKDGHGMVNVWQQQIEQFRNVSRDMAAAIVSEFPSPQLLRQAYQKCDTESGAMHLLKDILVRRGGGSIATSRKIGPELSKRFYILFHLKDSSELMKT